MEILKNNFNGTIDKIIKDLISKKIERKTLFKENKI